MKHQTFYFQLNVLRFVWFRIKTGSWNNPGRDGGQIGQGHRYEWFGTQTILTHSCQHDVLQQVGQPFLQAHQRQRVKVWSGPRDAFCAVPLVYDARDEERNAWTVGICYFKLRLTIGPLIRILEILDREKWEMLAKNICLICQLLVWDCYKQ